jgi:hypothetical protein
MPSALPACQYWRPVVVLQGKLPMLGGRGGTLFGDLEKSAYDHGLHTSWGQP